MHSVSSRGFFLRKPLSTFDLICQACIAREISYMTVFSMHGLSALAGSSQFASPYFRVDQKEIIDS